MDEDTVPVHVKVNCAQFKELLSDSIIYMYNVHVHVYCIHTVIYMYMYMYIVY